MALKVIYIETEIATEELFASLKLDPDWMRGLNPHIADLARLEPGIPLNVPVEAYEFYRELHDPGAAFFLPHGRIPYAIAHRELMIGVSEDPRPGHDNPRIVMYHATTIGGAMPDEVSWCSSFVNYCVEMAGQRGTDSKVARSWLRWGADVTANPHEGDIIVFWTDRPDGWQGHVGFFVGFEAQDALVLGGNQFDAVCIIRYPRNQILSIRR
jgi:uncharacterized protein (TIGR02594 family)